MAALVQATLKYIYKSEKTLSLALTLKRRKNPTSLNVQPNLSMAFSCLRLINLIYLHR
jgi:hypothetical protein